MHPMLNIAVRAARAAGKILVKSFGVEVDLNVTAKSQNDFVSEIDHAAEQAIISVIRKTYPDHAIMAEESGLTTGRDNDHQWIIDPLDRSEEHTSELQSRENLVCRLLLEKKKKNKKLK